MPIQIVIDEYIFKFTILIRALTDSGALCSRGRHAAHVPTDGSGSTDAAVTLLWYSTRCTMCYKVSIVMHSPFQRTRLIKMKDTQ